MKKVYNKLVRDNIPEIIIGNGGLPSVRVLDSDEYKSELERKLGEEYQEVLGTTTRNDRLEELADMLEIIESLANIEDSSLDSVIEIAKEKKLKRGGFNKRIFLESVDE